MAMFIGTAWSSYRDFSSLSTTNHGKLILATIQTSLVMVGQVKDAYTVVRHYPYPPPLVN